MRRKSHKTTNDKVTLNVLGRRNDTSIVQTDNMYMRVARLKKGCKDVRIKGTFTTIMSPVITGKFSTR
jgi:hypothetical protein